MNQTVLELAGLRRRSLDVGATRLPTGGVTRAVVRRGTARLGIGLLAVVLALVVLGPALSGQSVYSQDGVQLQAPSTQHRFRPEAPPKPGTSASPCGPGSPRSR